MTQTEFHRQLKKLQRQHARLLRRRNRPQAQTNGIFTRYEHPVLTAEHTPLAWRYDFNHASNPHLLTRLGVNAVFNVGAIELGKKILLLARVEGWDRKSFFAVAESRGGTDQFRFCRAARRQPAARFVRGGGALRHRTDEGFDPMGTAAGPENPRLAPAKLRAAPGVCEW
jgi:hypothetical protein